MNNQDSTILRKPDWLKIKLPNNKTYTDIKQIVTNNKLHTICESGNCPNMGECWGAGTATFMILGDICTRSCKFCAVKTGKPFVPDIDEPNNITKSINLMKLKHCVITSVDRDDLPDGGANHWYKTIISIKNNCKNVTQECLIPDFNGNTDLLDIIVKANPTIVSHNMETVRRLTKEVRVFAKYDRSLFVLKYLTENGLKTKSGIMLGLGESNDEIHNTLEDIFNSGCRIVTIGQYLRPTKQHLAVLKYYSPDEFSKIRDFALKIGFIHVESAPLVRSSYHAEKHI